MKEIKVLKEMRAAGLPEEDQAELVYEPLSGYLGEVWHRVIK